MPPASCTVVASPPVPPPLFASAKTSCLNAVSPTSLLLPFHATLSSARPPFLIHSLQAFARSMRAFHPASRAATKTACSRAIGLSTQRCLCGSSSVPPSSSASPDARSTTAKRTGFVSSTRFTLSPSQVTDENVPSASDVAAMIPSLKELKAQLPGARELETKYIGGMEAVSKPSESTEKGIFQPTTDPLEDLIEGTANEGAQKPNHTHVLLAYRALLWGTLYALLGVSLTVLVAMYCCGYHSVRELMDGVRGKVARDEARLRSSAEQRSARDGEVVKHYVIDLTHPSQAMEQLREIWAAVQDIAEAESKENDDVPPKKD